MFDLEESISNWRKQMLAAGVKTPVPLEELEIHLRESIKSLRLLEIPEVQAFEIAMSRLEKNKMSDLDQSIAEWRGQMLAAGIKTPVPLEELEIHLREEIEQQVKSGLDEPDAFNFAVQKIGQARMVQKEFKKLGFRGVPMPVGCKVLGARFEMI